MCDFSEKGQKMSKRAKYLKIWAKMYKIWKYFEKGGDYCMHEIATIYPDCTLQITFLTGTLEFFVIPK